MDLQNASELMEPSFEQFNILLRNSNSNLGLIAGDTNSSQAHQLVSTNSFELNTGTSISENSDSGLAHTNSSISSGDSIRIGLCEFGLRHLQLADFDFKIKANEEILEAHKAVLAANSPVFAAMFRHEMEGTVKNEMTIEHRPESVKELLAFVYLRKVPDKCFNATDLYAMAHEYQITELSEQIAWLISLDVNGENASTMFKFGSLYNNDIIKGAAFRAMGKSLNRNLPKKLLKSKSIELLKELFDAKDKLDEVLKRIDKI